MKINVIEKKNIFLLISLTIIVLGLIFSFVSGVNLDIQFKGGSMLVYSYDGEVDVNKLGDDLVKATGMKISPIQENKGEGSESGSITISFAEDSTLSVDKQIEIEKFFAEDENYKSMNFHREEEITVDPSIGGEYLRRGILALLLAAALIVIYVWYRFRVMEGPSAGIIALVALIHDVLIVFIAFVVLDIPINENFIAVILTIVGYSINDTIVIYDRIRENLNNNPENLSLPDLVNKSIHQSFARTLNTSITTFTAMLMTYVFAYIYGIKSVQNFALPMMIGIISGFYTSLFLTSPLWVTWKTRKVRAKL